MRNTELPISLEEQVLQMKKYVLFRQRKKMRNFLNYAGYFRASRYGKFLLSRVGVTGAKSKQDGLFALYNFDVELRRILSFYCNRVEIRFKSAISNACSIKMNDGTFYLDTQSYTPSRGDRDANQEVKRIDQEQFKALMEMEAPSTRYASTAIADPQTGKTMLPIWDEVLTNFYRAMEWDEDIITVMS